MKSSSVSLDRSQERQMKSLLHAPPRPIKVLYIHHASTVGGASNSLRYLIQSFPPGAIEAHVLCPSGTALDAFRMAGIRTTIIPGVSQFGSPLRGTRWLTILREVWYLTSARYIRKAISEYGPDIVHLNELTMLHAAMVAKSVGKPVVMHARVVVDRGGGWIHNLSVSMMEKYVDIVIAIDGSVRSSLQEIERCTIVYNPYGSGVRQNENNTTICTMSPQNSDQRIRITFLSILLEQKGIWDLLDAATLLNHRRDIVIQIAGGNSRSRQFHSCVWGKACHLLGIAPDLESEVARFINRKHLQDIVTMLGHVTDINGLFGCTDILVFPSHMNGPSRSVFEAGIHGIPTVITMRDRVEDVVEHNVTGLIVPEKDPDALARALETLVDNKDLRIQLGKNAQHKYSSQFDPGVSANKVLEVYRTLLES